MKSAILISSVMISAGLLTACGGGNQPSPSSAPASTGGQSSITAMPSTSAPSSNVAPSGSQIVISNFAYTVPASVSPGQQVTVVNNDSPNHTVTSDAGNLFDVRVSGGGGFTTFIAPADPGTYPFHCKYHSDMHGSLTVQ
jgi:plastocyanin